MNNLLDEINMFAHTPNSSLYINTSTLGVAEGIGGMIIDLICNFVISQDNILPFVFFIDDACVIIGTNQKKPSKINGLQMI